MIRSTLRLPEMDQPDTFGRWLVRHVVGLTLGSLLVLATLTVVALSTVRVEVTIEAAGTVERTSSGELGVLLQVPVAAAGQVAEGQAVRIRRPGVGSSASPSFEGTTVSVGPPERGATVPVSVRLELESSADSLPAGTIVQGRIVAGRQRASERLFDSLKRKSGE